MANILLDCWLMHVCMTLITQTVLPPVIMSSSSASCIWQRRLWSFAFRSALALSFPSHTLRGPNVAGMPKCFYVFGAPHTSCKRRCPHPQRLLLSPSAHGFDFSALSLSPALPLLWYFSSVTTARSVVFFCFFFSFSVSSRRLSFSFSFSFLPSRAKQQQQQGGGGREERSVAAYWIGGEQMLVAVAGYRIRIGI